MERYYTQAVNAEVVSTNGEFIGRVLEVLVDPNTGKVAGFLLFPKGKKVLAPSDIVFWDQHIIIHDADDIMEINEILKVKEVLAKHTPIIKNKVFTEDKIYLGTVMNFAIDTKHFVLTKILVAKAILGIFYHDEKIITYNNIIEITPDAIIVKSPRIPLKVKEKSSAKGNLNVAAAGNADLRSLLRSLRRDR